MIKEEINKVINESCFDTMKRFDDKSIDLTLTDPPYGIELEYDVWIDTEENWKELMHALIPEVIRVSKMAIMPSCRIQYLSWIYQNHPPDWLMCWYKGSVGHQAYIGFNDWEPLLVYGRRQNRMAMHDYMKIKSSPKKGTHGHPCPKPVEWSDWLIKRASFIDDMIYDPFSGSGTTGVSAVKLNRKFIGSEISSEYTDIANKRINRQINLEGLMGF